MFRNKINHIVFLTYKPKICPGSLSMHAIKKNFLKAQCFLYCGPIIIRLTWLQEGFQQAVSLPPPTTSSSFNGSSSENDMILFKLSYPQKGKVYRFIDSSQRCYPVYAWNKKINVILLGNISVSSSLFCFLIT